MDASTSVETHQEPHGHDAAHEHHELGFWRKYIFSTDHKVIGIQYGFTGLIFLLFGFSLMMLMRWQLAYPGQALPTLEAGIIMQLMDRVAATSFFMPVGLVVNGTPLSISGGGSPLLWQHLFWFLAHPEVYVLILPGMGIVAEILANNSRKPLWGYKSLVFSVLTIGFLSFIVWAHHMWLTGMGSTVSAFFQTTTLIISIPSVIIMSAFFISLWGGSIRFTVPMLFATAFLPMFGIGRLTGIPLAFKSYDLYLP